jgi:hypothetical protein
MGNNLAYSIFEETVVAAYKLGKLDRALLSVLMEPYRHMDIDSGGKTGLIGDDGLEVEEICIKIMGDKVPDRPNLPTDRDQWTPQQYAENDEYHDSVSEAFSKISDQFGWE